MTDNEIIKALECCAVMYDCPDCPFECDCGNMGNLSTAAIDLINRLNERDKKNERIIELSDKTIKTQSAEIDFLRASKNLHEAEFNEAKVELELKKAEIKRLQNILGGTSKVLSETCAGVRIETIKEFADKYEKAVLPLLTSATLDKKDGIHACLDILKEMVGDDNGES